MNYKKILRDALIGYIGFLIILFFLQGFFIYHPQTIEAYNQNDLDKINATVVSDKGLEWLYLPSENISNKTLIYFHGNAGMAIHRAWKASFWRDAGFNVVLAEYPAYGTNDGKPSENSFYRAGRIIIDKTLTDFPAAVLYIYGESIGSGTAVQMATEYDERALIIEAGFSSLGDVAYSKLPIIPFGLLLRDRYDNIAKINNIGSRLVVIHGARDRTVSPRFGHQLFDAYKGQKDILIFDDAGHNDIYMKTDMNAVIRDLKL